MDIKGVKNVEKIKTRLFLIVLIFGFFVLPIPSLASCGTPPIGVDFYNFDKSNLVFVGIVTDVYNPHPEIHTGFEEYDTITFDVVRVLKGDVGDGTVRTNHGSIFYEFKVGKSYLVYAFGETREVSQCTPPILLYNASALTIHEFENYVLFLIIGVIAAIFLVVLKRKRK